MSEARRMLATMVALQESHNLQVASDWRTRGLKFQRAIWVECAELFDHFGWKWWKQQTPDLGQVKLELVDIWHFGLSQLMQEAKRSAPKKPPPRSAPPYITSVPHSPSNRISFLKLVPPTALKDTSMRSVFSIVRTCSA